MFRGRRVELDLGDDEEQHGAGQEDSLSGAFVGDILERKPAAAKPPTAPTLKSTSGFPEHKKRNVESRFKQRQKSSAAQAAHDVAGHTTVQAEVQNATGNINARGWEEEEKQRIDHENRQKLAQMSSEEIEAERQELMNTLSPALVQRLLQRSDIDSGASESDLSSRPGTLPETTKKLESSTSKTVTFADDVDEVILPATSRANVEAVDDQETPLAEPFPHESVHFPRPPQPPDLDPSSDTFFDDLHDKYFPSLPSDPDKLEWMQSSASAKDTYNPSASTLSPKDIRFDFKGDLIPPRTASDIPVTEALHHHGDAPDAAGYTIPELSLLAQSSYPAQRCIAFQTLGRILYRLGRGEFGDSGEPGTDADNAEDTFGELARGLWREVEKEKVIEILVRESEGTGIDRGRHLSAKAYATEAVWLWQKGGGRQWKAG